MNFAKALALRKICNKYLISGVISMLIAYFHWLTQWFIVFPLVGFGVKMAFLGPLGLLISPEVGQFIWLEALPVNFLPCYSIRGRPLLMAALD